MTYIFERPVQTFEYEDIFRLIKLIYSQDRSISNLKRIESIARCAAEGIKNPFFPDGVDLTIFNVRSWKWAPYPEDGHWEQLQIISSIIIQWCGSEDYCNKLYKNLGDKHSRLIGAY